LKLLLIHIFISLCRFNDVVCDVLLPTLKRSPYLYTKRNIAIKWTDRVDLHKDRQIDRQVDRNTDGLIYRWTVFTDGQYLQMDSIYRWTVFTDGQYLQMDSIYRWTEEMDREDGQIDGQTVGQTVGWTVQHTDEQLERYTDPQMDM
jgi:hypothetical protein